MADGAIPPSGPPRSPGRSPGYRYAPGEIVDRELARARQAGLNVQGYELRPGGAVVILTGEPGLTGADGLAHTDELAAMRARRDARGR